MTVCGMMAGRSEDEDEEDDAESVSQGNMSMEMTELLHKYHEHQQTLRQLKAMQQVCCVPLPGCILLVGMFVCRV